jgi:hypothetical protein
MNNSDNSRTAAINENKVLQNSVQSNVEIKAFKPWEIKK